jgi:hypothetical protein
LHPSGKRPSIPSWRWSLSWLTMHTTMCR